MFADVYIRIFPYLTKIQAIALILCSTIASICLWLAPLPTEVKNADPAAMKAIAVGGVALFGALMPLVVAFSKTGSKLALKLVAVTLAGLANGFALSPLLATPVQAVASIVAALLCTSLGSSLVLELQGSILAQDPKSTF